MATSTSASIRSNDDGEVSMMVRTSAAAAAVLPPRSPSLSPPSYKPDDDLPSNVCERSQLKLLPKECLSSDDDERPLRHVDDQGKAYHYALKPMTYSVYLILLVELLERFR